MAVTQFEATDARRALPCWDEPAIKATFNVTLITESHLTAVSNMPVVIKRTVAVSVLHVINCMFGVLCCAHDMLML